MPTSNPFPRSRLMLVAIVLLLAAGCGSPDEPSSAIGSWNPLTPTAYDDYSTPAPTVTPGGVPPGYDGVIIEGTLVITGAASLEANFRYPAYGDPAYSSCSAYAEGISRGRAQSETEQIFYEMERYLQLPVPHDAAHYPEPPSTPAPISRAWITVRIMPYDGPGTYDQTDNVFVRPEAKTMPAGAIVPAIDYPPLPRIEFDEAAYDQLAHDSTIRATIAPDGSGNITFTRIRRLDDPSSEGVSGEMTWTCTNESRSSDTP